MTSSLDGSPPVRCLVTGASGFVGRHARAEFEAHGVVWLPLTSDAGNFVDLRDSEAVETQVARLTPDWVLHLAAQSFVPASFEDPRETFDINVMGTLNLLVALRRAEFSGRMLFVGSGAQYGNVPVESLPVSEAHPLRPTNPYSASKVAAEALALQWGRTEGFEVVAARPFNHIGPGQADHFAVASFASQIVDVKLGAREPRIQVGDVDVTRDFTDVRDIVRAYRMLLERGRPGEVYNICSGSERRLRDIIDDLAELSGVSIQVTTDRSRMRRSDQLRMVGDHQRIHRDVGWAPQIEFERTLTHILSDWEKVRG